MPLSMISAGDTRAIMRINGNDAIRHHLANLGFVEGAQITVVAKNNGNLIVNVKETRVAIDKSMANRIFV